MPGCPPLPLPRTLKSLPLRSTPRTKGRTPVAAMAEGREDPAAAPRPGTPRPLAGPSPGPAPAVTHAGIGRYFRARVGGANAAPRPHWLGPRRGRAVSAGRGRAGAARARAGPGPGPGLGSRPGSGAGPASPPSLGSGGALIPPVPAPPVPREALR